MGRNIRSTLPAFHSQLNPKLPDVSRLRQREQDSRLQRQVNFNRRHTSAPLSTLQPGTEVVITNHDQPGTVVKEADGPRSFVIETPTINICQNIEHLVPVESSPKSPTPKKLPELNISLRPRRTVKPSLKALENAATS